MVHRYFLLADDSDGALVTNLILPLINELGMLALPTKIHLSNVIIQFDNCGQPKDGKLQEKFKLLADEFLWYTETLRNKRVTMGVPK